MSFPTDNQQEILGLEKGIRDVSPSDAALTEEQMLVDEQLLLKINQLSKAVLKAYNGIIISGGYINLIYKTDINWINGKISGLVELLFDHKSLIVQDSINSLKSALDEASNMLAILHSRTCSNSKESNYLSEHSFINVFEEKSKSIKVDGYALFVQNIKLAFIDHSLAIKTEQLEQLIQIKVSLSDNIMRQYSQSEILLDKCNYLIYKVLFRLSKDENNYNYIYNNRDTLISIDDTRSSVKIFEPFLKVTDAHYSDQSSQSNQRISQDIVRKAQIANSKLKNGSQLKCEEFHTLIKFLKDVNHNQKDIVKLKEKFFSIQIGEVATKDFDVTALDINRNYIYNNLISGAIDSKKSVKHVKSILDSIVELQKETGMKNYFPFFKISEYYELNIENIFLSLSDDGYKGLSKIELWMQDYKDTINQCYQNFKWCKERNYTAFQLPFDECILDSSISGVSQKLFLASSFVLPLNYSDIETQLSKLDRNYNRIKTQVALYKTVRKERLEMERLKDLLTNEVIERDRKQIEILGIFAAIVLFSVSQVQLFANIKSIPEAIMFSLAFAYSLGTFVILIWLITRNYKIKLSALHWIFVSFFILATGFLYYTLIGWELLKGLTFKW